VGYWLQERYSCLCYWLQGKYSYFLLVVSELECLLLVVNESVGWLVVHYTQPAIVCVAHVWLFP
jgi:hypothetical protein